MVRGRSLGLGSAEQEVVALETFLTNLWSPVCASSGVVVVDGVVGSVDVEKSVVLDTITRPSETGRSDALVGGP